MWLLYIQYNYIDDCSRKTIEFNAGDLYLLHQSRDERISTASIYSLVYAAIVIIYFLRVRDPLANNLVLYKPNVDVGYA